MKQLRTNPKQCRDREITADRNGVGCSDWMELVDPRFPGDGAQGWGGNYTQKCSKRPMDEFELGNMTELGCAPCVWKAVTSGQSGHLATAEI